MKSITEFASFTLNQGLKAKTALAAEGKTPEEIQASLGETFKYEGDKLKHFFNAIDVAGTNTEGLKRVLVVTLSEGENAPNKAIKVEETHYVPDFYVAPRPPAPPEENQGKGRGRGGKGRGGDRNNRGGGDRGGVQKSAPPQKSDKKAE